MSTTINILVTLALIPWPVILMMSPMMIAAEGFRDNKSSLLFATLMMSYPVIVFTVLKFVGYHFWGMNVNGWLIGCLFVSGGIIYIYGIPKMLMNLQMGISNSGYFKNKSAVFLDGHKIPGAHPESFERINADPFYAKDNFHVFYRRSIVKGADPASFIPVENVEHSSFRNTMPVYWKDKTDVYFNGQPITGVDAGTFHYLQGTYGKDRNHVYYGDKILDVVDPEKFRFLSEEITSDGTSLFILNKRSNVQVDLPSFKVVGIDNGIFCKDKDHVYLLFYLQQEPLVKIDGADPETFTLLERYYAKDQHNVYYYGHNKHNKRFLTQLTGADPNKFTVGFDSITQSDARDGVNYYMSGAIVRK